MTESNLGTKPVQSDCNGFSSSNRYGLACGSLLSVVVLNLLCIFEYIGVCRAVYRPCENKKHRNETMNTSRRNSVSNTDGNRENAIRINTAQRER